MEKLASNAPRLASRYLTVEEVSEYLSFNEQTIWRWAREGSIPCFKVGNKFRFRLTEIDDWMEKRRQRSIFKNPETLEVISQTSGRRS